MAVEKMLHAAEQGLEGALARLMDFLKIPSISTDPAHKADCARAADWLVAELQSLGFDASTRPTQGHPMVVAHSAPADRKILFYGHYDVQPVDPLDLWDRPPFDPVLEDGTDGKVIRARGASDDKGQLMTFIEACRAWKQVHGALPAGLILFFEGEEESGSPSLVPFLHDNAYELRADLALICDTGLYADGRPAIVTMLRGLVGEEVVIRGADRDLHSGMFGGLAANPIMVLAKALASLKDENGRITLPGFYEGVEDLTPELRTQWESLNFDAEGFLAEVGLKTPIGENGRMPLEMVWSQPACEINGITGGYTGEGFKTVLPGEARAKVSFRLTGTQNPQAIRDAFRDHIRAHLPADCTATFHGHGCGAASRMNVTHPAFAAALSALTEEWGRDAAFIGSGGSIPIAGDFQQILGMDTILMGFAKDDDRIHSPNEKYDVESFRKGIRSWLRLLDRL